MIACTYMFDLMKSCFLFKTWLREKHMWNDVDVFIVET